MERRLAITYAVSATATLCTACVAVATISGGLFVQAAPSLNAGIKQVETVDEYIVVHSPATTNPAGTVVAQAFVAAPATVAETTTTVAPEPVVAPALAVAAVQQAVPAAPAASESEVTAPESSDDHESDSHTRAPAGDQTSTSGYGSHDRHYSDDEHQSDDHEHEGGDD